MGQRDIIWIRISKSSFERGFHIRHLGEILHAKLLNDYPAIVDKVQVTLYTDLAEVESRLAEARQVYRERNLRLESMTDESVDTFYSCLLCQSFAPNHVCVITPERLGLCGAYNWLDGKAAYEIDPTGPNQPLTKGECIDPVRGQWKDINDYVFVNSKQSIERFNAYSMLEDPMTSCGCFEAIVALLPECNGVMIVNREFPGQTPAGMKFSTLAGNTGGGQQTPGFIGIGKAYISSKKFIFAEGGHQRIVWMPKELKETLKFELELISKRLGIDNFVDLIADETVGSDTAAIMEHMKKVNHPALAMWDITSPSPEAAAIDANRGKVAPPASVPSQESLPAAPPRTAETPVSAAERLPAPAPAAPAAAPALPPAPGAADGLSYVINVLNQVQQAGAPALGAALTPEQQMAALQWSTAVNLLTAGANMLLMHSGALGQACTPGIAGVSPAPLAAAVSAPVETAAPAATVTERPIAPATMVMPTTFTVPGENISAAVRTVTVGGSGTRTSAVTLGGAQALPFRHCEGNVGQRPAIAMEVFDQAPAKYPDSLREAYGNLLQDPAAMAQYCVNELGAELISIRLDGAHPDQDDKSPEACAAAVEQVLGAVGVPLIVTGPAHFEKNNAVMKTIAAAFPNENLLLNWAETDNYKTLAAAAMGYNHCLVAQTPIDVNMAKQLNILITNMGLAADKIVIDPMTGALGYGLEYTYSVMERIRTAAFTGDGMLAMPMFVVPGYEVAKTKESKASAVDFPLWGEAQDRGALLEIATAMSLLNAGADLLVMYQPLAVKTVRRKIAEMMTVSV